MYPKRREVTPSLAVPPAETEGDDDYPRKRLVAIITTASVISVKMGGKGDWKCLFSEGDGVVS